MQFGKVIGTACSTFAITNIDDLFVLVTFFAEAATTKTITPLKITIGQYLGFTVIIAVSLIGFAVSLVLPAEPLGFLGLLPMLLGVWMMLEWFFPDPDEDESTESSTLSRMKSILKVSSITVMNGGDNIGTYIPLFSQTKGAEIAVYVVTYYILLGLWCLAAFLVMKQKHVLLVAQKYAHVAVPILYTGLGVYIVVTSSCYPWAIELIDVSMSSGAGRGIMAGVTVFVLLVCIAIMLWLKLRSNAIQATPEEAQSDNASREPPSPRAETEFHESVSPSPTTHVSRESQNGDD